MATETVDLEYRANISQLLSELKRLTPMSEKEFKSLAKGIDTQLKRTEKSAKRAAKNNKKNFKGLEDAAGEADSVLQGLSATLDVIDPRLGAVARLAGDLSGGLEAAARAGSGLGLYLGAAGAAVTALGAAWFYLRQEEEKANDEIERSRRELNDMIRLTDQMAAAKLELRIASGELTDDEIRQARASEKAAGVYGNAIAAARDRYGETQKAASEAARAVDQFGASWTVLLGPFAGGILAAKQFADASENIEATKNASASAAGELQNLTAQAAKYEEIVATTDLENYRNAQQGSAAAVRDTSGALAELDAIADGAYRSRLSGEALIIAQLGEELARIEELEAAQGQYYIAIRARQEVEQTAQHEIDALKKAAYDEERARLAAIGREKDAEAARDIARAEQTAQETQDAYLNLADSLAGAIGDVFGITADKLAETFRDTKDELLSLSENVSNAERRALLAQLKAEKKAAEDVWRISQGLAISQAIISGAVASVGAWQTARGNPVIAIPLMAAVAAQVAAQIAVIGSQSPSFHSGGIIGGADPSARQITARRGEGVLTAQGVAAAGGRTGLDTLNRGASPNAPVLLELRVGNDLSSQILYDGSRGPGKGRQLTRGLRARGRSNPYRRGA